MSGPHALIVGGGASGVLLAAHLLRSTVTLRVTIVEKRDSLGRGVACATRDASHRLDTRVADMRAFPDDPEHFWRRLNDTGEVGTGGCRTPFTAVPDIRMQAKAPAVRIAGDPAQRIDGIDRSRPAGA